MGIESDWNGHTFDPWKKGKIRRDWPEEGTLVLKQLAHRQSKRHVMCQYAETAKTIGGSEDQPLTQDNLSAALGCTFNFNLDRG